MNYFETKKLAIVERSANGKIREIPLNKALMMEAQAGAIYSIKDLATGKTPKGMLIRRQGLAMVVIVDEQQVLELTEFFTERAQAAAFYTDVNSIYLPVEASTSATSSVVTQASPPIADISSARPLIWAEHSSSIAMVTAGTLGSTIPALAFGGVFLNSVASGIGNGSQGTGTSDTTPPPTPTAALAVTDALAPLTGNVSGSGATNDPRPTLSGSGAEPGTVVKIYDGATLIGSTTVGNNGAWSFTPSADLGDGEHSLTYTLTDPAGNVSAASPAMTFAVDAAAPTTPTATVVVTDALAPVTGNVSGSGATNDPRPTLSGSGAEPGTVVKIYDGATLIGSTTVGNDGAWSFTPPADLGDGEHSLTYTLTDPAGNVSEASPAMTFAVDAAAPTTPTAALVVTDAQNPDTGNVSDSGATNDPRPTLSGSGAEPGTVVKIYDGATLIGSTTVGIDGEWSFTPSADLGDGEHSLTYTLTDPAGNVSEAGPAIAFSVDANAPTTPTAALIVTDALAPVTGNVSGSGATNDPRPTLSGSGAEPGTTVNIYDGATLIGSTTVGIDGAWSFTPPADLGDGEHSLTFTLTDPAGNVSEASPAIAFSVDANPPTTPTSALVVTDAIAPLIGNVSDSGATNDPRPTLSGTGAEVGTTVKIYDGETLIGSTTVGNDGTWSFTPSADFDLGSHRLTYTLTDTSGTVSEPSPALVFSLDTSQPTATAVSQNDTDGPSNGVTLQVTLPAGLTAGDVITVLVKDASNATVATTTYTLTQTDIDNASASPTVNADIGNPLPDGTYTLTVTLEDSAGNTSGATGGQFTITTGLVHDDLIVGATVFVDANNNSALDAGEQQTTTDAQGRFQFTNLAAGAIIVSIGGVDTTSGVASNSLVYRAYGPSSEAAAQGVDVVLSPLSTLIASVASQQAATSGAPTQLELEEAAATVAQVLGLSDVTDTAALLNYDAVTESATGTAEGIQVMAASRQVAALLTSLGSLISGASTSGTSAQDVSDSVTDALASLIQTRSDTSTSLDITNALDLEAVLATTFERANSEQITAGLTASNTADLTTLATVLSNVNQSLKTSTETQFDLGGASTEADRASALASAQATMRLVANDISTQLQNVGQQALSERQVADGNGDLTTDLSLSALESGLSGTSLVDYEDSDTLQSQIAADAGSSGTLNQIATTVAAGTTGQYVPIDFQLPTSLMGAAGTTAVTITGLGDGVTLYLGQGSSAQLLEAVDGVYTLSLDDLGLLTMISTVAAGGSLEVSIDANGDSYQGNIGYLIAPGIASIQIGDAQELLRGALTTDNTPTVSGQLDGALGADQRLAIYDGSTFLGYAQVDSDLAWRYVPELDNTAHNITARVVQDDGQGAPLEVNGVIVGGTATTPFPITVASVAGFFSVQTLSDTVLDSPAPGEFVSITFQVSRSAGNGAAAVDWSLDGAQASDFPNGVLPTGTVTFAAGASTASVTIQVPASATQEALRQIRVTLEANEASGGYVLDPTGNTATVGVQDSTFANATSHFVVASAQNGQIIEGAEGVTQEVLYTVTRSGDTSDALNLTWRIDPQGSALLSADDFDASDLSGGALPHGTVVFNAGAASATFVLAVAGDNYVGPNEDFQLVLDGLPVGSIVSGATRGSLINDDAYISVATESVTNPAPGQASHQFVISRSGASDVAHTVSYAVVPAGEQGVDTAQLNMLLSGDIRFAAGETRKVITVSTVDNPNVAGYETLALQLTRATGSNVTLLNDTALSTLVPNHEEVTLQAVLDRGLEGNAAGSAVPLEYLVTRSGNVNQAATLQWTVEGSGDNAAKATDFAGGAYPCGTLQFLAGQTTATILVTPSEDYVLEGDQAFSLRLSTTQNNIQMLNSVATGTVVDDECAVGFESQSASRSEGDSGTVTLQAAVSRLGFTGATSVVEWRLSPELSGANLADFAAGQDLLGDNNGYPSGTLTLLPGEGGGVISVGIAPDSALESNESFTLALSNASVGTKIVGQDGITWTGASDVLTGTIANDDAVLSLATATQSQAEGNGGTTGLMTVTVQRTGSTTGADWVKWTLTGTGDHPVDATDLGQSNSAMAVFDQYDNSWIDLANTSGSMSATGTVELPSSGYIMVAYNRDLRYANPDETNLPFDQFLLQQLSVSGGATLTSLGSVSNTDFLTSNAVVTSSDEQRVFSSSSDNGTTLPGAAQGGQRVILSSETNLAGMFFQVSGYDASGNTIYETVRGPKAGSIETNQYFASVTRVETVQAAVAVGFLAAAGDWAWYGRTDFAEQASVPDQAGLLAIDNNDYGTSSAVHGANDAGAPGQVVIKSQADLSDKTFVVHGGISVAVFDNTGYSSNDSGQTTTEQKNWDFTNSYPSRNELQLDTPTHIRAEQMSGNFQSRDSSAAPHYFQVTGLDASGQQISETLVVSDFDPKGIADIASGQAGELLLSTQSAAHPALLGRVVLTTDDTNLSGIQFTVTGTDATGGVISETIDGPDWSNYTYSWNNEASRYGDQASVATRPMFASVTSVVASEGFTGDLWIGFNQPAETTQAFATVLGIAPVDSSGNALANNQMASGAGRIEFTVPKDIVLQGPQAGESISSGLLSYVSSVEVRTGIASDARISIGFDPSLNPAAQYHTLSLADLSQITGMAAADIDQIYLQWWNSSGNSELQFNYGDAQDQNWSSPWYQYVSASDVLAGKLRYKGSSVEISLYAEDENQTQTDNVSHTFSAPSTSQNFIVGSSSNASVTGSANNNLGVEDTDDDTGNLVPYADSNLAYVIFKVDAPGASPDQPVTLSFDLQKIGRAGIDTGSLGFAPVGTWSPDLATQQSNGSNLLIPALSTALKTHVMTLEEFNNRGRIDVSEIASININDWYGDNNSDQLQYNDGTLELPIWVNFSDSQAMSDSDSTVLVADITAGKLRTVGSGYVGIDAEVFDADEDYIDDFSFYTGPTTTITLADFGNLAQVDPDAINNVAMDSWDSSRLQFNQGTAAAPEWVRFSDWEDDNGNDVSATDIAAGKMRYIGSNTYLAADVEYGDNQSEWIDTDLEVSDPADIINSSGAVALSGDGYIWVRFTNQADGQNDGADMAWINSLSVDGGATLKVVGQKAVSDGVANSQTLQAGAGSLDLNGSAVQHPYQQTEQTQRTGSLIAIVTPQDGALYNDTLQLRITAQDTSGNSLSWTGDDGLYIDDSGVGDGSYARGGQRSVAQLDGIDLNTLARITYSENSNPNNSNFYARTISFATGDLKSLADYVSVTEALPQLPHALTLANFNQTDAGVLSLSQITLVQIGYFWDGALQYNEGSAEAPDWVNFADSATMVASNNSLAAADIADGKLRYLGNSTGFNATVTYTGDSGEASTGFSRSVYPDHVLGLDYFAGIADVAASAIDHVLFQNISGTLEQNQGVDGAPNWVRINAGTSVRAQDIADGKLRYTGTDTQIQPTVVTTDAADHEVNWQSLQSIDGLLASFNPDRDQFAPGAPIGSTTPAFTHSLASSAAVSASGSSTWLLGDGTASVKSLGAKVTLSSADDLSGRSFVVHGTNAQGNTITESLSNLSSGVLATTQVFATVTGIAVGAGQNSGHVSIGQAVSFDAPNTFFTYAEDAMASTSVTVIGLDAEGQFVERTMEGLAPNTVTSSGVFSEIWSVSVTNPSEGSIKYLHREGDGFTDIELDGTRDANGYLGFDAPSRITIGMEDGDNAANQDFRVTGLDANGQTVTETIHGIGNDATAITQQYFSKLLTVEFGPSTNQYGRSFQVSVGTIGAPIVPEQPLSRFGGVVELGEAQAAFGTASKLSFTSADDLRERHFTVTGTLADGSTVTETVTGVNNNTTLTTHAFMTVTDVSVDAGAVGSVKVGFVTTQGGMTDQFVVTGGGTALDPITGHSTNTVESGLRYDNDQASAQASEADVLLYVDFNGARPGTVNLHYDVSVQGAASQDTLSMEYSSVQQNLQQGTVYFADGADTATITLPIVGNDLLESDKTMKLELTTSSQGTSVASTQSSSVLTIANDDDLVSLNTAAQTGVEGNGANGLIYYTVTRQGTSAAKTVAWELIDLSDGGGTQSSADDFATTTGTVTFAAGQTSATIALEITADHRHERNETFTLQLSDPELGSGYSLTGNSMAQGTIVNDDVGISIAVDQPNLAEGNTSTVARTYTVTRVGDLSQASDLDFSVIGQSGSGYSGATGADFSGGVLPTGLVHFDALSGAASQGTQTQTITLRTSTDTVLTGNRRFDVLLENASGDSSNITGASVSDRIVEDDQVQITADSLSQAEGTATLNGGTDATAFSYTLQRTGDTSRSVTLDWAVLLQDGQANAADFDIGQDALDTNAGRPSGTVTFDAGSATASISLRVMADALVELDEAFTLRFSASDADVAAQSLTSTIVGDDAGYAVETTVQSLTEANTGTNTQISFTLVRAGSAKDAAATMGWSVRGLAASSGDSSSDAATADDFVGGVLPGQTLSFAAGQASITVTLNVAGNNTYENDRSFVVDLTNADAVTVASSSTITVNDDDARLSVTVDKGSFAEGSYAGSGGTANDRYETLTYTVTREGNLDQATTVDWNVAANSGITADDFTSGGDSLGSNGGRPSGTVSFATGASTATVTLLVARDSVQEIDEVVQLVLSNASAGSALTDGSDGKSSTASTTVVDEDAEVNFIATDLTKSLLEAQSAGRYGADSEYTTLIYQVHRSGNTNQLTTVNWGLVYGSGADSNDFVLPSATTLTFAVGSTDDQTFEVRVRKDQLAELDEGFHVSLRGASVGSSVGSTGQSAGTILNDDLGLQLAAGFATAISHPEGQSGTTEFTWTIERTGDTSQTVSVDWSVQDGGGATATDMVDGVFPAGTLVFAAGETRKPLTVSVQGDISLEDTERFVVAFTKPSNVNDFRIDPDSTASTQYLAGYINRDEAQLSIGNELNAADLAAAQASMPVGELDLSAAKAEADSGVVHHYFKVSRAYTTIGDVTVTWQVNDLSGASQIQVQDVNQYLRHSTLAFASASDFAEGQNQTDPLVDLPSGTATILDGQDFTIIDIQTKGDTLGEHGEAFTVSLGTVVTTGSTISMQATGSGHIANDDPLFSLGLVNPSSDEPMTYGSKAVQEGGNAVYRVYRSGDTSHAATVDWAVTYPTAPAGYQADANDFDTPTTGTLSFVAGESYKDLTIGIKDDGAAENWAQVFAIALSNPQWSSADAGTKTLAVSSLANNLESLLLDAQAGSTVAVSAVVTNGAIEGTTGGSVSGTTITYTLTRSGDTSAAGQIGWSLNAPNTSDITSITGATVAHAMTNAKQLGLVTFAAGQPSKTIVVNITADSDVEANAEIEFTLVDAKSILLQPNDSDNAYAYQANALGTAGYGNDGLSQSNSAGIQLLDSVAWLPDSASMLRDPSQYQVNTTILNDDSRITINNTWGYWSTPGLYVREGDSGTSYVNLDLTRLGKIDYDVSVHYKVIANGTAVDGTDVVVASGDRVLSAGTFVNGLDTKTYQLELPVILGNTTPEADKTFTVRLTSSDANTTFAQTAAADKSVVDLSVSIVNDDTTWSISAAATPLVQTEGNSGTLPYTFTITRPSGDNNYAGAATVQWSIAGSTSHAAAGADFVGGVLPSGSEPFASGVFTKTITVYVAADTLAEYNEMFTVNLTGASYGQIHSSASSLEMGILNDDTSISISDASVREGDAGQADLVFTVTRAGQLGTASSAAWTASNAGTLGTSDNDFTAPKSGTVSFDASTDSVTDGYASQTQEITLRVLGDTNVEADESLNVQLSALVNINDQARTNGTGTVRNDDTVFSIASGGSTPVAEGDSAGQAFTISRTMATVQDQTVNWSLAGLGLHPANAGASSGSLDPMDFVAISGDVTFTGSELTKTFYVQSAQDTVAELDESFRITITAGTGAGNTGTTFPVTTATADGTILNDDAALSVLISSANVQEGSGSDLHNLSFIVRRSGPSTGTASVDWTLSGDAASNGDFATLLGTVNFASGEVDKTVTVAVNANTQQESDRTYTVTLSNAVGSAQIIPGSDSATGSIIDDESSVAVADASVLEAHAGSTNLAFTLTRSGHTAYATTLSWHVEATSNASNNADALDFANASLPSGTVTLAAGQATTALNVALQGDSRFEGDETFRLVIDTPASGLSITQGTATGTILNDDVRLQIADASTSIQQSEGTNGDTQSISFVINRSGPTTGTSTVQWQIVSPTGNTTNGTGDFLSYSDTVSFSAGETSKTVTLEIAADAVSEADEQFYVQLVNPGLGSSIDTNAAQQVLTVVNDDIDQISVLANSASQLEGNVADGDYTVYSFTVSRLDPTISASVEWSVAGSGAYALASDQFYIGAAGGYTYGTGGTVDFAVGEISQLVTLAVKTNAVGDFDRTFSLTLSDPSAGSELAAQNSTVQATLVNDDPALHVELLPSASADHNYLEGNGVMGTLVSFKVLRTGSSAGVATVSWQLQADGSETTNMADWGGYWPSGSVVFADGQSEKTVQVRVASDRVFEEDEGFTVALSNAMNATIIVDPALASGVLVNDDNGVSVIAQQASLIEGDSGMQYASFDIAAQGVAGQNIFISYVVEGSGSVPANGADFEGGEFPQGTVNLQIGSDGTASYALQMGVNGDTTFGTDETFRLRIVSVTNGSIAQGSAQVTISNDDSRVSISQTAVAHAENGAADTTDFVYTVTRTGDLTRAAVVGYNVEGLGDNQATALDFVGGMLPQGSVTFEANQSSVELVLSTQGNSLFENDKAFAVKLTQLGAADVSSDQNAASMDPAATMARGTILNDDSAGLVVNGLATTVTEGNTGDQRYLSYEIIRNGDALQPLTVNYTLVQDGSYALPNASAIVGGLSGEVTFAAGESRKLLNLQVVGNDLPGDDLHFQLAVADLAAGGLATLTDPIASTVVDDDSGITVQATQTTSQAEGAAGTTRTYDFVVARAGSNLGATEVHWTLAGAGANPGNAADLADGQATSGTLVFAAGVASATIQVQVKGDGIVEPEEMLRLTLDSSSDTSQQIQLASADVLIGNDDAVTTGNDVVYGSTSANVINGYSGNDFIKGGAASDLLFGGDGNDTLVGAGGADQLYGGAGNDTVVIHADNRTYLHGIGTLLAIDGAGGMDTVAFDGGELEFDFSGLQAQITNIEKINIDGSGANTLLLDQAFFSEQAMGLFNVDGDLNVRDALHQLMVDGGADDEVLMSLEGWQQQSTPWTYAGSDYNVYVNTQTQSELLLKVGVTLTDHPFA